MDNQSIIYGQSMDMVGGLNLKNMSSSIGMMIFPIYRKIKCMFQTTNQKMADDYRLCQMIVENVG